MVPLHTILCRWKICFAGPVAFYRVFYVQNVSCFMQKLQSLSARVLWTFLWIHSFFNAFFLIGLNHAIQYVYKCQNQTDLNKRIVEFGIPKSMLAHQNYQQVRKQGYITKFFQLVKLMYSEKATKKEHLLFHKKITVIIGWSSMDIFMNSFIF